MLAVNDHCCPLGSQGAVKPLIGHACKDELGSIAARVRAVNERMDGCTSAAHRVAQIASDPHQNDVAAAANAPDLPRQYLSISSILISGRWLSCAFERYYNDWSASFNNPISNSVR